MMKRKILLGAMSMLPLLLAANTPAPEYDIVIRGGRVLDGAGSPWVSADVAVKDGRVVRIGRVAGRGAKEIDAKGPLCLAGLHRHDGPVGARSRQERRGREQAADGRDHRHRRRRRPARPRRRRFRRISASSKSRASRSITAPIIRRRRRA
jgi:imidazolonepropionase-like amidohydrolase